MTPTQEAEKIVWLTPKQRMRLDVTSLFADDPKAPVFQQAFQDSLKKDCERLDSWMLGLFSLQFALWAVLILRPLGAHPKFTLMGVSVDDIRGLSEILICIYALLGVLNVFVGLFRDLRVDLADALASVTQSEKSAALYKLGSAAALGSAFYFPRSYDQWIFPKRRHAVLAISGVISSVLLISTVVGIGLTSTVYFIVSVWTDVSLQLIYRCVTIIFVSLCLLTSVTWAFLLRLPRKFRDNSEMHSAYVASQRLADNSR